MARGGEMFLGWKITSIKQAGRSIDLQLYPR
jgi:hypothetical protein